MAAPAFGGGQVTLNGIDGYVQLPAGILSDKDAVTIEAWANIASIPSASNAWLFAFGDQNTAASPQGRNYIGIHTLYGRGECLVALWNG